MHLLFALIVCFITNVAFVAQAFAAQAELDQSETRLGASVLLTLQADDQLAGYELDLKRLTIDFDIVGTTTGTRLRMHNGRLTPKTSWLIHLRPKRSGTLAIPPITINDEFTDALTLLVHPPAVQINTLDQLARVETTLMPEQPYVQAQAIYTLRIIFSGTLRHSDIVLPRQRDFHMQPLGDAEVLTEPWQNKTINVWQQRYALFAERSGRLILPEIKIIARLSHTATSHFSAKRNHTVTLATKPKEVIIRPKPANLTNAYWLPANDIKLSREPFTHPLRVGEAHLYTLALEAKGLRGIQLPALPLPSLQQVRFYPDRPKVTSSISKDNIIGQVSQAITMIPLQAGQLQLPETKLTWWDTQAEQARTSVLPAQALQILPALSTPAINTNSSIVGSNSMTTKTQDRIWIYTSGALLLLWLATLYAWRCERNSSDLNLSS